MPLLPCLILFWPPLCDSSCRLHTCRTSTSFVAISARSDIFLPAASAVAPSIRSEWNGNSSGLRRDVATTSLTSLRTRSYRTSLSRLPNLPYRTTPTELPNRYEAIEAWWERLRKHDINTNLRRGSHRLRSRAFSTRQPRLGSTRVRFEYVPTLVCALQTQHRPCRPVAIDHYPTACPGHNRDYPTSESTSHGPRTSCPTKPQYTNPNVEPATPSFLPATMRLPPDVRQNSAINAATMFSPLDNFLAWLINQRLPNVCSRSPQERQTRSCPAWFAGQHVVTTSRAGIVLSFLLPCHIQTPSRQRLVLPGSRINPRLFRWFGSGGPSHRLRTNLLFFHEIRVDRDELSETLVRGTGKYIN